MASILVDAATADEAVERVVQETGECPGEVRELPAGLLFCEQSQSEVVGDAVWVPFDDFAEWVEDAEDEDIPPAPAPDAAETQPGGVDGQ